jgi:hypothetical protein
MIPQKKERLYRVRFLDPSERKTIEIVCKKVYSSEFLGLVTMEKLVFSRNSALLILPEEEAAEKRYSKTERLHIPYSAIVYVEEFDDSPGELKTLPFVKEVSPLEDKSNNSKSTAEKTFSPAGLILPKGI